MHCSCTQIAKYNANIAFDFQLEGGYEEGVFSADHSPLPDHCAIQGQNCGCSWGGWGIEDFS